MGTSLKTRRRRHSSNPSMPGSMRSTSTTSGWRRARASRAASPLSARSTALPSSSRTSCSDSLMRSSSSTIRIRAPISSSSPQTRTVPGFRRRQRNGVQRREHALGLPRRDLLQNSCHLQATGGDAYHGPGREKPGVEGGVEVRGRHVQCSRADRAGCRPCPADSSRLVYPGKCGSDRAHDDLCSGGRGILRGTKCSSGRLPCRPLGWPCNWATPKYTTSAMSWSKPTSYSHRRAARRSSAPSRAPTRQRGSSLSGKTGSTVNGMGTRA